MRARSKAKRMLYAHCDSSSGVQVTVIVRNGQEVSKSSPKKFPELTQWQKGLKVASLWATTPRSTDNSTRKQYLNAPTLFTIQQDLSRIFTTLFRGGLTPIGRDKAICNFPCHCHSTGPSRNPAVKHISPGSPT
jgi:hypothetical protein